MGFSMSCLGLNIGFLLSDYADKTESYQHIMDTQNFVFFVELVMEIVVGLVGFGPGSFFKVT